MNRMLEGVERQQAELTVNLAEYSALRNEIINFQSIEHQSISFAIAAITGLIGLIVTTLVQGSRPNRFMLIWSGLRYSWVPHRFCYWDSYLLMRRFASFRLQVICIRNYAPEFRR